MKVLGIDPGAHGAIALITPDGLVAVEDMPSVSIELQSLTKSGRAKKRYEVDPGPLAEIVRAWAPEFVFIERVGGITGQSASASFNFGRAAGVAEGVVRGMGVEHALVPPSVWKRGVGLPPGSDKAASRKLAQDLFPARRAAFKRVRDDGRAEAALLALYGLRHLTGETT